MDRRLNFYQIKHRISGTGAVRTTQQWSNFMTSPEWTALREQLTDQIYIEIALHIKLELKTTKY